MCPGVSYCVPNPGMIIVIIIITIIIVPMTIIELQMAATACLFNLSKPDLGAKIHPKILKEIVKSK